MEIEPSFIKSYFRKAKALINQQKMIDAMETLKKGREMDPDCIEIREMIQEVEMEIE
jgi:hypothetical protein